MRPYQLVRSVQDHGILFYQIGRVVAQNVLIKKDPMILNRSYLGSQIPSLSMKSRSNCISVYN
uniref:Uncharacterized protein n=1 Tax=Brassica oleracea TaxID=3712 RepID=A0A3P6GIB5_BRAOL|nr:unnamed protein product [Brassica oleracea]